MKTIHGHEFPSSEELEHWEQENNKAIERLEYWERVLDGIALLIGFVIFFLVWRIMLELM